MKKSNTWFVVWDNGDETWSADPIGSEKEAIEAAEDFIMGDGTIESEYYIAKTTHAITLVAKTEKLKGDKHD